MSVSSGGARVRTLQCHSQAIPQHLGVPLLEPLRLGGREALNELFTYELFVKSPDGLNPALLSTPRPTSTSMPSSAGMSTTQVSTVRGG